MDESLKFKLERKRGRVLQRYKYYEMKDGYSGRSFVIPEPLRREYASVMGWCAKGVDALADRLVFLKFKNDDFMLNQIYEQNNPDVFFDSAILSALISSCCFIYISPDEEGFPRLQVIDGGNATGTIDPITGLLKEGYAVLERDEDTGLITKEAFFSPGVTVYYENGKLADTRSYNVDYPLLVPVIFRPDAQRPFGHSRISRTCMYLQKNAKRVLERMDVSAEFYSFPQKYVLGTSNEEEAEPLDKWKATIATLLEITKDEDGDKPSVGQFTQQSMQPFIEQLRCVASVFAGETGLTLDDLGFVSDNPSSVEAIRASHENLRLTARKAQRSFGSAFLNAGFLGACLRDDVPYKRRQLYRTKPVWEPLFEPDASMLSSIGDGAIKINQAVEGYINSETLREITGSDSEQ